MASKRETAKMASKSTIAKYWLECGDDLSALYGVPFEWVIDPAEPTCWACGGWQERWDRPAIKSAPYIRWNKAKGLVKCHLVPHALGGSDYSHNIVLLCKDCHEAAPDTIYPKIMIQWMNNRNWLNLLIDRYKIACDQLGINFEDFVSKLSALTEAEKIQIQKSYTSHFSRGNGCMMKATSVVAAVMAGKEWTNHNA